MFWSAPNHLSHRLQGQLKVAHLEGSLQFFSIDLTISAFVYSVKPLQPLLAGLNHSLKAKMHHKGHNFLLDTPSSTRGGAGLPQNLRPKEKKRSH
jgi:hypothetical protein